MTPPPDAAQKQSIKQFFNTFRYSPRALVLVWETSPLLTIIMGLLTLIAGLLPAGVAYIGKLLVDSVVEAMKSGQTSLPLYYVLLEGVLVGLLLATQRGLDVCQSLLRAMLGHKVNVMILEKALKMSLPQFEDAEFYDRLTRARREASSRPLSLVKRIFGLVQNIISLITYCILLFSFSPWAVLLLAVAGLPSFIAETKFSGEAFRLFRWRSPETRQQMYLEIMMAREDYTKEVQLYGLGPIFLERYRDIFKRLFKDDKNLTFRRNIWGTFLGLLSAGVLYGAYAWTVIETVNGRLTLGEMTMYLLVFKQGQSAFSASLNAVGGMFEDNLYLSTLYEFLEQPDKSFEGSKKAGPMPGDGVRFEDVTFTYPGSDFKALNEVSFHLKPGYKLALVGENGAGKTTLIKLLTRLYEPAAGRITLDGLDIREWDIETLREEVGVIFQDFARYQLILGENIGAGDIQHFEDQNQWEIAAEKGMADQFIEKLPNQYQTQLGRWFKNGQELSGGQWQRIALARAFMRQRARVLVLDEPTSAMDAEAEAQIFDRFQAMTKDQMAILISHRFSTVRMADHIIVLQGGKVMEEGTHEELMKNDEQYARLFTLQAQGYL